MRCSQLRPYAWLPLVLLLLWGYLLDICEGKNLTASERAPLRLSYKGFEISNSNGTAQNDAANNKANSRSHSFESNRPTKVLVRAAGCKEDGSAVMHTSHSPYIATGCLRGGNSAQASKKLTTSNAEMETYKQPKEPGHTAPLTRQAQTTTINESRSSTRAPKSASKFPGDDMHSPKASPQIREKIAGGTSMPPFGNPILGSTSEIPMQSQFAHTTTAPMNDGDQWTWRIVRSETIEPNGIETGSNGSGNGLVPGQALRTTSAAPAKGCGDYAESITERCVKHQNSSTHKKNDPIISQRQKVLKTSSRSTNSVYKNTSSKRASLSIDVIEGEGSDARIAYHHTKGHSIVSILIQTEQTHISTSTTKNNSSNKYEKSNRKSGLIRGIDGGSDSNQIKVTRKYKGGRANKTKNGSTATAFAGEGSLVSVLIKTEDKHRSHATTKGKTKATRYTRNKALKSNKLSIKKISLNGVEHWLRKHHGKGRNSRSKYADHGDDSSRVVDDWLTTLKGKRFTVKTSKSSKTKNLSKEKLRKSKSKNTKNSQKKLKSEKKSSSSKSGPSSHAAMTIAPMFLFPIVSPPTPSQPAFSPVFRETVAPTGITFDRPVALETETPIVDTSTPTMGAISLGPSSESTARPPNSSASIAPAAAPTVVKSSQAPSSVPVSTSSPTREDFTSKPIVSPISSASISPTVSTVGKQTLSPVVRETPSPVQPTIQSLEPSVSPSLVRASPLAQPPGQVNASPFNIVFESNKQPSESDLLAAGTLTLQYLKEFLTAQFEFNSEIELVEPSGTVTATDVTQALVAFDVSLLFSEGRFVPTSSDIDNLLFAAFQPPFVDGLLSTLAMNLPSDNPLATTSQVLYSKSRR